MIAGVDIGGTFTDIVVADGDALRLHKLLSTPADPAAAMLVGLSTLMGAAPPTHIAHGSTIATNAILERRGAASALIATQGFRDVLFIARQNRPDLYALHPTLPPPLIQREHCFEVSERLDHRGDVLIPLDLDALDRVIDALAAAQIESVAVCLLYSYLNPTHERAIRDGIVARGVLPSERVVLSSDVLPAFREYERAHTTALEAYVRPMIDRYLGRLERELPAPLRVMKSDGGVISAAQARERALSMALSGPAAGVIGALHIAKHAGFDNIITLDIGGTSTDIALCPGAAILRAEAEIDGLPLRTRSLDIETIGAGGGSLARIDSGGALRVGPESAGATPGPIVYGLGGTQITVSDANALLGRLDPDHFLGGAMQLHLDPVKAAFADFARTMNTTPERAALGVIDVANANIERAIQRVSVARGHDPRDFTLFAFGGAGALHACAVAARLNIPRVLIPRHPGVLCAFGLLAADVRLEYSRAIMKTAEASDCDEALQAALTHLRRQSAADLEREGFDPILDGVQQIVTLDARYIGQAYELSIHPADLTPTAIISAFHTAHERAYGYALPERPIEVVNLRLSAIAIVDKPIMMPDSADTTPPNTPDSLLGRKPVQFADGVHEAVLVDRERLMPGAIIDAPALCFQYDSTILIPLGWTARVDAFHNLIVERT
ncbi:MAG: hydantoinase/oxoprolinase family protein [Chloroflexota bacterium]|nr:hydantoinase/oxoprolinase family protein [Chloroflexota bacterium]